MPSEPVRLNRYLASCGLGSRRACDQIIQAGRVSINGKPVSSPGDRVSPFVDRVCVDGSPVRAEGTRVFMVHKPRNILCTVSDPEGRRTVLDLLPPTQVRLYPVGRLDQNSEGLILVTNDGELANRLTHPRYHVEKEYVVWTREPLREEQIRRILDGVNVDGERLRALSVRASPTKGRYPCSLMVLGEGRNRHIRRMAEAVDVDVTRIKRIRLGSLELRDLPVGGVRELSGAELRALKRAVGL